MTISAKTKSEYTCALRKGVWWLSPAWTAVLIVGPGLLVVWFSSDATFRELWRTPKYITPAQTLWFGACLLAFVVGTWLASKRRKAARTTMLTITRSEADMIRTAGTICFTLAVLGYLTWALLAITGGVNADLIRAVLDGTPGASSRIKQYMRPVAGITTFTQFAPPAVVCLLADRRLSARRNTTLLVTLVLCSAVRALLYAERLALLEVLIPFVVMHAAWPARGVRRRRDKWWAMLPIAAPVAVAGIFGSYEYLRSWTWASRTSDGDYLSYMLERLSAYYATPFNNSALILEHIAPRLRAPFYTWDGIWSFPLTPLFVNVHETLGMDPQTAWVSVRMRLSNPEFNNQGFGGPIADYGNYGALLWWLVIGAAIGVCYQSLRSGRLPGLLAYPVVYIGLLEMPRYHYWTAGRSVPALAAVLVLAYALSRARTRSHIVNAKLTHQRTGSPTLDKEKR